MPARGLWLQHVWGVGVANALSLSTAHRVWPGTGSHHDHPVSSSNPLPLVVAAAAAVARAGPSKWGEEGEEKVGRVEKEEGGGVGV